MHGTKLKGQMLHKTQHGKLRSALRIGCELGCTGIVSSYYLNNRTRHVTHGRNMVISHNLINQEWGKKYEIVTTAAFDQVMKN